MLVKVWATGTLLHGWGEWRLAQLLWKTVWWGPRGLSIELRCDPAIALLGVYPKGLKAETQADTCTPIFMAALFTRAKMWKQQVPVDGWLEIWCICTMGSYSATRRNAVPKPATPWRNLEDSMQSDRGQTEKNGENPPIIETESRWEITRD